MKQVFMCVVCKTEKVGEKGLPEEWERQNYLGFANVNLCEKCKRCNFNLGEDKNGKTKNV